MFPTSPGQRDFFMSYHNVEGRFRKGRRQRYTLVLSLHATSLVVKERTMKDKPFYVQFIDSVSEADDIGYMEYRLLISLLRYANAEGHCFPSRELLAKSARLNPTRVSSLTGELAKKGFLEKKVGRKGVVTTHYQLLIRDASPEQSYSRCNQQSYSSSNYTPDVTLGSKDTPDVTSKDTPDVNLHDAEGESRRYHKVTPEVSQGDSKVTPEVTTKIRQPLPIRTNEEPSKEEEPIKEPISDGADDFFEGDASLENEQTGVTQEYDPAFDEEIDFDSLESADEKWAREQREAEEAQQTYLENLPDFLKNPRPYLDIAQEPPFSLEDYPGWKGVWGNSKEGTSAACKNIKHALKTWYRDAIQRAVKAAATKVPAPDDRSRYFYGCLQRELKRGQVAL